MAVLYPVNPALRVGVPSSRQTPLLTNVTEGMATTFSLSQGSLPPGMILNSDGSYSGTPTAGTFDFTLKASNDARQATDAIHVSVVPADYKQAPFRRSGRGEIPPRSQRLCLLRRRQ
ncbi:MAG: putative Ig domain-containing protein [Verrucomicrobia bacterium]|nr:putative Ig domain-containing protein [Verrucomicrobiota bacterium]